jgi:hypothetical protein
VQSDLAKTTVNVPKLIIALIYISTLAGCGGGDGATGSSPTPATGVVRSGALGAPLISGIHYRTNTFSGTTNANGSFSYRCDPACESVTFSIGATTIGTASGTDELLLRELDGGMTDGHLSTLTINRASLLFSLDADGDPTNGVTISTETVASMATVSIRIDSAGFHTELAALLDSLRIDPRIPSGVGSSLVLFPAAAARALIEQGESLRRGVLVESFGDSSAATSIRKYVVRAPQSLLSALPEGMPLVARVFSAGLHPGIGAGLALLQTDGQLNHEFLTATDGTVVLDAPRYFDGADTYPARVLPMPGLNPRLGIVKVSQSSAELQSLAPLKLTSGTALSGRPIRPGFSGSVNQRALNVLLRPLDEEFDDLGFHPGGVAVQTKGSYWICDRNGPFLANVSADGQVLYRYGPSGSSGSLPNVLRRLPEVLSWRQNGSGCGGVGILPSGNGAVLAMRATLDITGRTKDRARFIRLVEIDLRSFSSRMFALPLVEGSSSHELLDFSLIADRKAIVLESVTGIQGTRLLVSRYDWSAATEVPEVLAAGPNAGLTPEYGSFTELRSSGIRLADRAVLLDLTEYGWAGADPEGLTVVDSRTIAVVGQSNHGIKSEVSGGASGLAMREMLVNIDGLITPVGPSGVPVYQILPDSPESRETVLWLMSLRDRLF